MAGFSRLLSLIGLRMASKTEICNMALRLLSANRIMNMDTDGTSEANDCLTFFDSVVQEVMAFGTWSSCTRRASLAMLATAPEFGYKHQFQLPTSPKVLRVIAINNVVITDDYKTYPRYTIEGDRLLADVNSVDIKYTAYITDTSQYNIYLTKAIVYNLAATLCYTMVGQVGVLDRFRQLAQDVTMECLALDNQQGTQEDYLYGDGC